MISADKQKIAAIMRENSLHAYLATCDGDQPWVRPVSPIVEDDMTVWVTTFGNSRKVNQVRMNPKICLAFVEQPRGDKTAIVFGEALAIIDPDEKKRVWKLATFDLSQ
ncbi:MAG: pyridoxamine 5'-phosphate oxidase family protein, partial [Candidatus Edwardsbacteria bacterium]|nr:pyridoxamine 5'-phosphate oxidase family protein [Candidatus Edwardsbacteria bacterium]